MPVLPRLRLRYSVCCSWSRADLKSPSITEESFSVTLPLASITMASGAFMSPGSGVAVA